MTDQELVLSALRQVGLIVAEHLESGTSDADEVITQLIAVLNTEELAAAMNRVERGMIAGDNVACGPPNSVQLTLVQRNNLPSSELMASLCGTEEWLSMIAGSDSFCFANVCYN